MKWAALRSGVGCAVVLSFSAASCTAPGKDATVGRRLKGVPTFQPESDCGWMRFFGALGSVMRHQGEQVDYAYLMGVSGAAFRMRVEPKDWCPSAQNPEGAGPWLYAKQALRATGYRGRFTDGKEVGKAEALRAIREHIDKGIPVVVTGAGIHPAPDFSSVVIGHEGEDDFLFYSYCHKGEEPDRAPGDKLVGQMLLVEKAGPALEPLQALTESLEVAVRMARAEEEDGYVSGFEAFDAWLRRLSEKEAEFAAMPADKLKGEWWKSAMNYEGLCDARGAARRYLLRMQKELPPGQAEKLRPVTEAFERIHKLVFENWKWFPFPHWVREDEGKIWTPLGMIDGTTWSPEIRANEAEALRSIRKAEADAHELIAGFLRQTAPAAAGEGDGNRNVRREGGRVWTEGVPSERVVKGIWHFDGALAALRAVLEYRGVEREHLDDTIFAGISGQPFRFWFSDDFSSCLAYTHERPLGAIVAETLGLDCVWHQGGYGNTSWEDILDGKGSLDQTAVESAWAAVKREIDAGNPVIVFGGHREPDPKASPVVVTGYDDEQGLAFFLPHSSWVPADEWDEADAECMVGIEAQGYRGRPVPTAKTWIGSGFAPGQGMGGAAVCYFAFGNRKRTPSRHEVAVAALRRAVAIGRGEAFDEKRPNRKGGLRALDLLAATLDSDEEVRRRDPDWWYAMEGLAWPEYRRTAAAFVERCASGFDDFSVTQRVHLVAAAMSYRASASQFDALWKHFLSVGPLEEYEERVKTVGTVLASRELRREAADIVRRIRAAEEEAIGEIENALASPPPRRSSLARHEDASPGPGRPMGSPDQRRADLEAALSMADAHRGTETGATALLVAARIHMGNCGDRELLAEDSWDRAITLYQRVIDGQPDGVLADQARWGIAMAHGVWTRHSCCEQRQGKRDWARAIELYRELYDRMGDLGSKRDALCRIAEIQCEYSGRWREGLATWRRVHDEYPGDTPPSPFRTFTGCGRGACDVEGRTVAGAFGWCMGSARDADEARALRDEFLALRPAGEPLRIWTLGRMADRLRDLGNAAGADEIGARLKPCNAWLFIGPFSCTGDAPAGGPGPAEASVAVRDLVDRTVRSAPQWGGSIPASLLREVTSAYDVETDVLSGRLDLSKAYPVWPVTARGGEGREPQRLGVEVGTKGRAAWIPTKYLGSGDNWSGIGSVYGLTYVHSAEAQAVQLRLHFSGHMKAWLNGRGVFDADRIPYVPRTDDFIAPAELKAGRNELLVKFTPASWTESVWIRLSGANGFAPAGIAYSVPEVPPGNAGRSDFLAPAGSPEP